MISESLGLFESSKNSTFWRLRIYLNRLLIGNHVGNATLRATPSPLPKSLSPAESTLARDETHQNE